jgi:hypothetical protein
MMLTHVTVRPAHREHREVEDRELERGGGASRGLDTHDKHRWSHLPRSPLQYR